MRLWSLHPKYLDNKGLVALWREALLAKAVLEEKTVGYKNHPQLNRFKESNNPLDQINNYLEHIYLESLQRGYKFNKDKFKQVPQDLPLTVTDKQIKYELGHLLAKLEIRDRAAYKNLSSQGEIVPHPLFQIIEGEVEDWEIVSG